MLAALILGLGGTSLYLNRDWFASEDIHVIHTSRPGRNRPQGRGAEASLVNPVIFGINKKLELTSVKVIPVSDLQTNKYPHPVWSLISDSNSVPVSSFPYGLTLRGMRPAIKGARAEPLQPGVNYRLLIEAGRNKAEHDFVPTAKTPQ